ncbi:MAG: hypothetical protein ACOC5T_04495 [Elusimicrobiota bacterium]
MKSLSFYFIKKYKFIKKKFLRFIKKIEPIFKKVKEAIKNNIFDYAKLIGFVIIYGVMINYVFFTFSLLPFNFRFITALGIVFYFIKEEFTEIVKECRR